MGESVLDLIRHDHGAFCQVCVFRFEGGKCLLQHAAAQLGEQLDVPSDGSRGGLGELLLFPTQGYRVIADALQGDIGLQYGGDTPKVARTGQVSGDEGMAKLIELARVAVDVTIIEYYLISEHPVAGEKRMDGTLYRFLDAVAHFLDFVADRCQVIFQSFFVVCHKQLS